MRRISAVALVLGMLAAAPSAASGAPFKRLGSDPAEGNPVADLRYLDVSQRNEKLHVRIGVELAKDLAATAKVAAIDWNFSLGYRTYLLRGWLQEGRYKLLNATELDTESCATLVAELSGTFDRALQRLELRIPLDLLNAKKGEVLGTRNYNECYEGLPAVRAYAWLEPEGEYVFARRVDDFHVTKTFTVR